MKSCAAGYTEWLLFHVWQKNKFTSCSCPGLLIPETIIYRLSKPFFWYFTDQNGEIMRKGKNQVNHKTILEELQLTENEIIAYYLGFHSNKTIGNNSAVIEFFTQISFQEFIQNPEKCKSGLLQKWVQPKTGYNSLIKVQWSSQFCLIERRTNKHRIEDNRIGLYEKLVTYEGMEHNSTFEPVAATWIISELQQICTNISSHITSITGGNVTITRMVLFFKHDPSDKLFFLYCSALKIMDLNEIEYEKPLLFEELEVKVPQHIFQEKIPLNIKGSDIKKNRKLCAGCNYLIRDSMMYDISLGIVVKFFIVNKNLPEQGESVRDSNKEQGTGIDKKNDLVPKVIRRLNKNITNEKYFEMINDPAWDHMQIKVCQDCFLHFTQVYANPEFYKGEKQGAKTPPKLFFNEPEPEKLNKKTSLPLSLNYPNIPAQRSMKNLELRRNKHKTEPMANNSTTQHKDSEILTNKIGDLLRNKKNRVVKKEGVEVNKEKYKKQGPNGDSSFSVLPPVGLNDKKMLEKKVKSSKQLEVKNKGKREFSDSLLVLYKGNQGNKSGNSFKSLQSVVTNHTKRNFESMSSEEFIRDTLSFLKSTISTLPAGGVKGDDKYVKDSF